MPQGYPGALPVQSPMTGLPGYSLPQPTSSGSLDLSAIKPVSTGNVSIADAIAKARSIAADRGISYDARPSVAPSQHSDPRLAGRTYRRSRSRSRSPQRREAYRDAYNPYRDERRDETRKGSGGFGRDRSPSPRGRGNFSPGPARARRSPPRRGGDGGDKETITVRSALVGLIIGRQGENLRKVEAETGARVQFVTASDPSATQRQCTISGSQRQRAEAKREIYRIIDENGGGGGSPENRGGAQQRGRMQHTGNDAPALREGEASIQIMVPDRTVGLIIGRGGETIRDLQERSGCHVNIVGENKSINGLRPVNLIGTHAAAATAKEIILEIVESDTRNGPNNNQTRDGGRGGFDSYRSRDGGENDKTSETVVVPSDAVGMIIGKGGETIKEMQNSTGCKINVNQPHSPDSEREISLVGTAEAIDRAKRAIWEKVDAVREKGNNRKGGGQENPNPYNERYLQQQQMPYGQQQQHQQQGAAPSGIPGMSQQAGAAPAGGDPNDPYAAYGGYQNYVAMWYAAMAQQQQQGGQGQQPSAGAQ
ncbi:hypothetical protein LTR66_012026 [Elasticomyces elasticus]|nr:hypothetical protein LTR66_012026 [Elasticomyces elasticus]